MAQTLPDDRHEELLTLHAEGLSNGKIAEALGTSHQIVGRVLRQYGRSANGYMPASFRTANARRGEEAAARRADLSDKLLTDAEHLRETAWDPVTISRTLPDGRTVTAEVEPSPRDRLNAIQGASEAVRASLALDAVDRTRDSGTMNLLLATAEALGLTDDGE